MKTSLRGLSLTAMLLSATVHGQTALGQSGTRIGDLSGYGEEAFYAPQAEYEQGADDQAVPAETATDVDMVDYVSDYQPASLSDRAATAPRMMNASAMISPPVMDGSCECGNGSCGSCAQEFMRPRRHLRCNTDAWMTAEALLWFPQARRSPALVVESSPGTAPIEGLGDAQVVFGGEDGLGGGLSGGFRIDGGVYLTENFGVGGRFWTLGENGDDYSAVGDGSDRSIGRAFFNTNLGQNDSILVAAESAGGATLFNGEIQATSSLEMLAAEGYGRLMFASGCEYRTDLIGGFTHYDIEDTLSINSVRLQNTPATGETLTLRDRIVAENQFNGGQVGFDTVLQRGRWMFSSLTKLHLGNMSQTVRASGSSVDVTPPAAGVEYAGGGLVLDNEGTFQRDVFALAPEVNVKIGHRFRDHVTFTAGYSIIYWSNLALAGEHANPVFDGTTLRTAGPYGQQPFEFQDAGLFVQGLDLGVVIDF